MCLQSGENIPTLAAKRQVGTEAFLERHLWFLTIRLALVDRLRRGWSGSTDTRLSGATHDRKGVDFGSAAARATLTVSSGKS